MVLRLVLLVIADTLVTKDMATLALEFVLTLIMMPQIADLLATFATPSRMETFGVKRGIANTHATLALGTLDWFVSIFSRTQTTVVASTIYVQQLKMEYRRVGPAPVITCADLALATLARTPALMCSMT